MLGKEPPLSLRGFLANQNSLEILLTSLGFASTWLGTIS